MKEQTSSAPPGARVYSYLRFSDIRQKAGTSVERQEEYAAKYARENGMELDTQLTLRDEGLSAYHQKHVKKGALGVFLKAIEDGRVPPGSVLIVESLDRLSRAEPMIAQAQLNNRRFTGKSDVGPTPDSGTSCSEHSSRVSNQPSPQNHSRRG